MLSKNKQVQTRVLAIVGFAMAAGAAVFKGSLTAVDGDGLAVPATRAEGLTTRGIARQAMDNSDGADGAKIVEVRRDECARLKNDAVEPVTRAHIGQPCYIVDDETVTSLAAGSSIAGTVEDLDDNGVWISFPA